MGVNDLSKEDFIDLYGAWAGNGAQQVAELFEGYAGHWYVAGGWALEAFTGIARKHDDVDPCVPRSELPLLRRHLAGRLHLWMATSGSLCPLLPDDRPDAGPDELLAPGCGQLWTRRNARSPWEFDILLATGDARTWAYKRDSRITRPVDEIIWTEDGISYLRPEVQLLHKARGLRPKDQWDFDIAAPMLDDGARTWLAGALELSEPGHPWIEALRRS